MNHIIERLVKDYMHNPEALEHISRFAAEVYIALLLEKAAEYLHDSLGKCLAKVREQLLDKWSLLRRELIPKMRAAMRKMAAKTFEALKGYKEFFVYVIRKRL